MFGRALLRLPVRSRLPGRAVYQCQLDNAARLPAVLALRTFATPGRPKSVVGEPSRPVKRSVKKAAAKPATGDSAAEKKTAAKKRKASTKAKKAKVPLTEEQKAAKKDKKKVTSEAAKLKELKSAALSPPSAQQRQSAWAVFLSEKMKTNEAVKKAGSRAERNAALSETVKAIAAEYKNLSAAELEHYNHLANQRKENGAAEYKRWVQSHPAEEIHRANQARFTLRRLDPKHKIKWQPIQDDRLVKRPTNSFTHFSINRNASGDFKNISIGERSKLIGQEWKALDPEEKSKYNKLQNQDLQRYISEFTSTYGYAPENATPPPAA